MNLYLRILVVAQLLCLILGQSHINHTIMKPSISVTSFGPEIMVVPSMHSFKIKFPEVGYEIGAQVYQDQSVGLLSQELFDQKVYKSSQSCKLYTSDLSLQIINEHRFNLNKQFVEQSIVNQKHKRAFVLLKNSTFNFQDSSDEQWKSIIRVYQFNQKTVNLVPLGYDLKEMGFEVSETSHFQMATYGQLLLVSDGVKVISIEFMQPAPIFWQVNPKTTKDKIGYKAPYELEINKFLFCHYNSSTKIISFNLIWDFQITRIDVDTTKRQYCQHISLDTSSEGVLKDVMAENENYFGLVGKNLMVWRKDGNKFSKDKIQLQSDYCFQISKFSSTMHIICRQGGLNYVSQYYYNQTFINPKEALYLNRYYIDIQDARKVFKFGDNMDPKMMIVGQEDILLTSYAINRNVLLEMEGEQNYNIYRAVGANQFYSIDQYSDKKSTYAIGVGAQFLVFFRIKQDQAEMECTLKRTSTFMRDNILVIFNVSNCPRNGDLEQLKSICQLKYAYSMYISAVEVGQSKGTVVSIAVFVLVAVIILLVLGCAFQVKNRRVKVIEELKKKIEDFRNRKKMKPI